MTRLETLRALGLAADKIAELRAALKFIEDLATEEYARQGGNVGAECALRHILKKCEDALSG